MGDIPAGVWILIGVAVALLVFHNQILDFIKSKKGNNGSSTGIPQSVEDLKEHVTSQIDALKEHVTASNRDQATAIASATRASVSAAADRAAAEVVSQVATPPQDPSTRVFMTRSEFDQWVKGQNLNVGLDFKWVKSDGEGGIGFYTQKDGTISTVQPPAQSPQPATVTTTAPTAPAQEETAVQFALRNHLDVARFVQFSNTFPGGTTWTDMLPAFATWTPPSAQPPLFPALTGSNRRDMLFIRACPDSFGSQAYLRLKDALGPALNWYINAYGGGGAYYDPMEDTGMLKYDANEKVIGIGGMSSEDFDMFKPELAAKGVV